MPLLLGAVTGFCTEKRKIIFLWILISKLYPVTLKWLHWHMYYKNSPSVSWAAFEVVVELGPLLTTHLYTPVLLSWTLSMIRVLVVAPDTPTGGGSKLAPFLCHRYVSVPASVVAVTVNITCDLWTTLSWLVGCWVIWGGSTRGKKQWQIYLVSVLPKHHQTYTCTVHCNTHNTHVHTLYCYI